MKKFLILTLCLLGTLTASARSIEITNQSVVRSGDHLIVSFEVNVARRAARGGNNVIYRPWLTDGTARWALPEIVVRSRRGRIAAERNLWVSGQEIDLTDARIVKNGDRFRYAATVPVQAWMNGAELLAETIVAGCCSSEVGSPVHLAQVSGFEMPKAAAPVVFDVKPPLTTGDRLADSRPWVLPAAEFDRNRLMFDDDREGALKVYFPVASYELNPYGNGNANVLNQLRSVIAELQASPDSRVAQIVVAGFASPEGSFELNDRLAYNRGAALKRYIAANSDIDPARIHIYNGAEDWAGLRAMVAESDMLHRERVLSAIDDVPLWDSNNNRGREHVITQIDNGRTWRFMLLNFFPELRKAAYIKVFYENK